MELISSMEKDKSIDVNSISNSLDIHEDKTTKYGAHKIGNKWIVTLWHPVAKNVELIIYDKVNQNKEYKKIKGKFKSPNWTFHVDEDVDGYFYQYKITQQDLSTTLALDPYSFSMASWNKQNNGTGKTAFVNIEKIKKQNKLRKINSPYPLIYEAHVRDITSLRKDVKAPGTYNALIDIDFGSYLSDLNYTHIQIQPINQCYTIDESSNKIMNKGDGDGSNTNYNWGYDPQNYFTISGQYSSNHNDPYTRIREFKKVVEHFHKNSIEVIVDVVYNHTFNAETFDNVIPNYYYRKGIEPQPAGCPSVATERKMVRRMIVDSVIFLIETYGIDGLRFDYGTFIDLETLEEIIKVARKIKPNFTFHGEAWNYTNIEPTNSFNKLMMDNEFDFGYFNDSVRNSIKGYDSHENLSDGGLIDGNMWYLSKYMSALLGSNMKIPSLIDENQIRGVGHNHIYNDRYDLFTNHISVALSYVSCHDGFTLWDKINIKVQGNKDRKLKAYKQALMLVNLLPGRVMHGQGIEQCYTKPFDDSGWELDKRSTSENYIDLFGLNNAFVHNNSYRTTDYTNGMKWIMNDDIEGIKNFVREINKFKTQTKYFNFTSLNYIIENFSFTNIDMQNGIIDFEIENEIRIIHNCGSNKYNTNLLNWKMVICSSDCKQNDDEIQSNTSYIFKKVN